MNQKIMNSLSKPLLFLLVIMVFASCKRETEYIITVNNKANFDVVMRFKTMEQKDTITIVVPSERLNPCEGATPPGCRNIIIYRDTVEGAQGGMSYGVFQQKLLYMNISTFDTLYTLREDLELRDVALYTEGTSWDGRTESHDYKLEIGNGFFDEK